MKVKVAVGSMVGGGAGVLVGEGAGVSLGGREVGVGSAVSVSATMVCAAAAAVAWMSGRLSVGAAGAPHALNNRLSTRIPARKCVFVILFSSVS